MFLGSHVIISFIKSHQSCSVCPGAFLNVFIIQKITGYALAQWVKPHMDFLPLGNKLTALRPMTSHAINQLMCGTHMWSATGSGPLPFFFFFFLEETEILRTHIFAPLWTGFHVSNHSGIFFIGTKHPADASRVCVGLMTSPTVNVRVNNICQKPQCPGGLARLTPAVRKLPSKLYGMASIGKQDLCSLIRSETTPNLLHVVQRCKKPCAFTPAKQVAPMWLVM